MDPWQKLRLLRVDTTAGSLFSVQAAEGRRYPIVFEPTVVERSMTLLFTGNIRSDHADGHFRLLFEVPSGKCNRTFHVIQLQSVISFPKKVA